MWVGENATFLCSIATTKCHNLTLGLQLQFVMGIMPIYFLSEYINNF